MVNPDSRPDGETPGQSDEFELKLEPVDPSELNLGQAPTVEIVESRKPGFGFWVALAWCLVFLALTQGAPATVLTVVYGQAINARIEQTIAEAKSDPSKPVDVSALLRKIIDSPEMRKVNQIALLVAPLFGILFCVFFIPRVVGKHWKRRVAIRLPHVEHVVLILLLFFPVFVYNIAFESLTTRLPRWLEQFNLPGMKELMESMLTWPAWVVTLGVAVGPAVSEELFCRAFLGNGLVSRFGTRRGVLLTSFFFGLIHLSLIQSLFAILMGILLHSVYLATRSLLAPILLHFLNNFFAVPAESKSIPIYLGSSLQHAFEIRPSLMILASTMMGAAIAMAFWACRARIVSTDGNEPPPETYPHVEIPRESSGDRATIGPIPLAVVGMLVVTTGFFAGIWCGL